MYIINQFRVQQATRHSRGRKLDDLNVVCFLCIPQCTDRGKELKKGDEGPWGCHSPHLLSNPDGDGGSPWPSAECNESVTALLLPMTQHKTMHTKNRAKREKEKLHFKIIDRKENIKSRLGYL